MGLSPDFINLKFKGRLDHNVLACVAGIDALGTREPPTQFCQMRTRLDAMPVEFLRLAPTPVAAVSALDRHRNNLGQRRFTRRRHVLRSALFLFCSYI